jgi:3-hydroxybutyryl-CoA dehydrogenase
MKHITVVGAGTMGIGVAHVAALSGFNVVLNDVSTDILDLALKNIKQNLKKGIERGKITDSQMDATLARIVLETDLEKAAKNADLIIETVVEQLDVKLALFQKLDQICKTETIFATNTSALSITELSAVTTRMDRFVGMHFFNPAHIMRLVEIIKGLETHDKTIDTVLSIVQTMGKDSVVVSDSPGFVTSRINVMIGNEAFYMLQEGVASAQDIDKALKLGLNHPMGPFELVDLVGLDIRLNVLRDLHKRLGEKFRPCPLLEKYVHAGRLGRKVGRGVFEYKDNPERT